MNYVFFSFFFLFFPLSLPFSSIFPLVTCDYNKEIFYVVFTCDVFIRHACIERIKAEGDGILSAENVSIYSKLSAILHVTVCLLHQCSIVPDV